MTDLPPYTDPARCPKCGHDSVCTRWQPAGTRFVSAHGPGAVLGFGEGCPEWMLRECDWCDYNWPEALPTLDPAQRVVDLQRELVRLLNQAAATTQAAGE